MADRPIAEMLDGKARRALSRRVQSPHVGPAPQRQKPAFPVQDARRRLDPMARAIAPDTKIVFLANPNNPTGTFLPWADIEAFIARVPPRVLVVIDEAYGEYLPCLLYTSPSPRDRTRSRLPTSA